MKLKMPNNKEISYINSKISNFKSNYCHICKEYGHDVSICNYNLKNPKRNKNIHKNKSFTKSKKKQFNNKNRNRKYIGNLEYESDSSKDDISFNDIKPMFKKGIENIEMPEEMDNKVNSVNTIEVLHDYNNNKNNNKEEEVIWTYDIGCSEHMTYDKNILKNFYKLDIKMKCANNTICNFEGRDTFEGMINGNYIKLNDVYYSPNINKNLISGIKLAKEGYSCKIKNKGENIILYLKAEENKKGKFFHLIT